MQYLAKMLVDRIHKNQGVAEILSVMGGDMTEKAIAKKLRILADEIEKIEENIPF